MMNLMKKRRRGALALVTAIGLGAPALAAGASAATPTAPTSPTTPTSAAHATATQAPAASAPATQAPAASAGTPKATSGSMSPTQLAATPNATQLDGKIYVPVTDENSVYLIDPATHTVLKKIRNVGMHPIVLRITPDHKKVYVDNFGPLQFSVSVIDTATNTITKRITTAGAAYASMSMAPDGKHIYVPTAASMVQVIDTTTDKIVKTFPILGQPFPIDLEVTPDGASFYAFTTYGTLSQYSTETGKRLRGPITVGGLAPGWAALNKDGSKLYAINFTTSNVTEIDTATFKVTRSTQMSLTALPLSATLTQDESEMWVANIGDDTIDIIDTSTMKIKQIIHTKNTPAYVGFSPDGSKAYVSDLGPVSGALKNLLRPVLFDIFYVLPPGITGYINEYDASTKQQTGQTVTGTGPVAGVYL